MTYIDTPELLDGAERDDLLQQLVPVVTLRIPLVIKFL